jgi:hypothetical protein
MINNESETDKQNQIKRIIKRWHTHNTLGFLSLVCVVVGVSIVLVSRGFDFDNLASTTIWLTIVCFSAFISRLFMNRFATRLTIEEQEALKQYKEADLSPNQKLIADQLLNISRRTHPERELLRASSPNQDDGTLLRAAAHGNEIPREELLRAAVTSQQEQPHEETIRLTAG